MTLAVHGGAWEIGPDVQAACLEAVTRAANRGWAALERGGSSVDACVEAIVELENDPVLDAGYGSHLNRDGRVQMDAVLMDGVSLKSGGVAAVERVRNPIRLARLVLERSPHDLIVGPGAERFAGECGMTLCAPEEMMAPVEVARWESARAVPVSGDTVGAIALDAAGRLAAGTSTGGTFRKQPGRVGDSPLVGCGCFADQESAAVSATGHGESIMRVILSKVAADLIARGASPAEAAGEAVRYLGRRTGGTGGLIAVGPDGRFGSAFSTPNMVVAVRSTAFDGVQTSI